MINPQQPQNNDHQDHPLLFLWFSRKTSATTREYQFYLILATLAQHLIQPVLLWGAGKLSEGSSLDMLRV